jgi:hypothetical protein|tara:strand:+ start:297 stop:473 length:177 start_codon:yes stop_codon:yes gene_type:complete
MANVILQQKFKKQIIMQQENNTPIHLNALLKNGEITYKQYFFRSGAYKYNIKTFKKND